MLRLFSKNTREESDNELLQRYQTEGDLHWLGLLFERYAPLVYGVCLKYLKDEQAAEDASMGVFESLIEKARKHEVHNFKSWLHVLTKNYCLMQLRKRKRQEEETFAPELMYSLDKRHHTIEWEEENVETDKLKHCMDTLPADQKACIEAFYLEGHTYKEIAAFRDEQLGKVRSYIQNGRRNLRLCMEKPAQQKTD
jgi:RNA polymerase sigma-70 factor (ECF subfamily)